jgi:alkylhydroperoxidase/carboxymuconolactone decarboxylase family protein YurZ
MLKLKGGCSLGRLNDRQRALKERFIKTRGYWSEEIWGNLLELDPDFFEGYLEFSSVPFKKSHLDLKSKELIYIAFDVAATHMYGPGTQAHMQNALNYGATKEEIMEVIEIASLLGMQAMAVGAPILREELERAGQPVNGELSDVQKQLKESFIETHGYWAEIWDAPLLLDPNLFAAYLGLASIPNRHGHLDPKMRALVYLTIDVAATHLYEPGVRLHIRQALEAGATKEEIIEVFELTSTLGIHAATFSVPILYGLVHGK